MLDKNFNHQEKEKQIYQKWEQLELFKARPESNKPPFCIVIPPPNVTGVLHMGHALDDSLQDVLCRYKRMQGFDVLWQPGTDHAGIATQIVVEKMLAKEGLSRHDLGREKFVDRVWEWKHKSGGQIINQLKALGASCDWSRERFTMDEGLSDAVLKIFVRMYKDGLIYKDKRLVNWDSKLQTAISDLEVIQKETVGKMWYFKYLSENNPNEFITVGTTRPETLFGDTAVAVSDKDERYQHLIGKNVLIPIINKPIPVIADEHADPEKGTGAVKITPAHDFNDFEVGKRHQLEMINILDTYGRLNENVPSEFQGLDPLTARPLVLEKINELGLYVKEEDNPMTIPYGERTGVVIEPYLTDQWFVDTPKLAIAAIEAVETGKTRFVPKMWENGYFEWMRNMQPWCISRQLWWGHQVPVWYGPDGHIFCEESEAEAQNQANAFYGKEVDLTRDSDVLDTWFSSGLWAFSTLGWPEQTLELKRYYPTSVLVTGFDIIPFWVARMLMMSLYEMKEIPFRDICIHGLVRDEKGQKMSKSKGNGIDPLEMIDKYGADALRMSLLVQAGSGRDVLVSDSRVESYRNFATKIWNAAKFTQLNNCVMTPSFDPKSVALSLNKWLVTKVAQTADAIAKSIDEYQFNDASNAVYHFAWGTFCDWYLELSKPVLNGSDTVMADETRQTTAWALDQILKMMHPFMPFITEEIWAQTAERSEMLMASAWPKYTDCIDTVAEKQIDFVIDMISAIRSVRVEMNVAPSIKAQLLIKDAAEQDAALIQNNQALILQLARLESIEFVKEAPKGCVQKIFGAMTLALPLAGLIDVQAEKERLMKEKEKLAGYLKGLNAKLSNEAFVSKAPANIIADQRQKQQETQTAIEKIDEAYARLADL